MPSKTTKKYSREETLKWSLEGEPAPSLLAWVELPPPVTTLELEQLIRNIRNRFVDRFTTLSRGSARALEPPRALFTETVGNTTDHPVRADAWKPKPDLTAQR
jgi:hypothetical protein